MEHIPDVIQAVHDAAPTIAHGIEHLADQAASGFGSGLAKQLTKSVASFVLRRDPEIYDTKVGRERLADFEDRLYRLLDDYEALLDQLPEEQREERDADPGVRLTMLEAFEMSGQVPAGETREVLADLVCRRLLTSEPSDAGRIRRAIAVVASLDPRQLKLLGAMGALLYPDDLRRWEPFGAAADTRDPGRLEAAIAEILQVLIPEDPHADDLATFVELGLAERDPSYEQYGAPSRADAIQSFLQGYGFMTLPGNALGNLPAIERASQLLMPRPQGGVLIRDDGQGLEGYRLLPAGFLLSQIVIDRMLIARAA